MSPEEDERQRRIAASILAKMRQNRGPSRHDIYRAAALTGMMSDPAFKPYSYSNLLEKATEIADKACEE